MLDTPLTSLPGVGPTRSSQLAALGLTTIKDLLYDVPFRYETIVRTTIAQIQDGMHVCIQARVLKKTPIKTARFRSMLKVRVADETGTLTLTWFNTPFILNSLQLDTLYWFTGKVTFFKGAYTITNPNVYQKEEIDGLIPVYHESATITSRLLRKLIHQSMGLVSLEDNPQAHTRAQRAHLPDLHTALSWIHQPQTEEQVRQATKRLAFDEMCSLLSEVRARKQAHEQTRPTTLFSLAPTLIEEYCSLLPYPLTATQQEAITAIAQDLGKACPMQRLIQGEVGSGKTTVAAFALYVAATQHTTSFLVCPTKILATQHAQTLRTLFASTGITVGLVTGAEKDLTADILVGTHALFSLSQQPSVVVIDEEHRFGVAQRETFLTGLTKPHFLSMTATPIPRTVALTALADKDVSYIRPHKNNDNIKTWVVPHAKRDQSYQWIRRTLDETQGQAFIICPFIDASSVDTLASVKSATQEYGTICQRFPTNTVELLHGKMKDEQKDAIFAAMMRKELDILVTTPVVEVGVDIPQACIIVIEGAERFGLSQLHQLRGRVGRRGQDAYCLLFTSSEDHDPARLNFFASSYDGNALAEYDLRHRGSGELLGVAQHGFGSLKFASWFDTELVSLCRRELETTQ